jgi:hypothetical protein
VVSRLKATLERFADALGCIDQCFIADDMLEHLPLASQVGKTLVGGIDLNKARMRQVVEAVIALSPSPNDCLRCRRSGTRPQQTNPITVRPSPRRLRSEETPRQTDPSPHRTLPPL